MAVRKYHREQVLRILDSFSEAVKEAKKIQQKGQPAAVINLLADIQEAVDFLDTFIKERDVDVTKTTTAITALNESLYYASEDVNSGTAGSNTFKHLLKLIYDVQKSVKEELKINKIEVVFMPYNASMWDSLESVYLSMTADDFCDAFVVPLPWNKLNEHQGIAERCYEGDQFPKDIPVTHYNDYDLESRHPEIIFIHNTYDEYNLVTRVDERFYTRNLKANCDKLVYIPYYGKLAGDLKHFEHFFHPVLFQNCDLVVAATEEEREFALEIKKKHKSNAKYEVAALGTPKYDRLFEYEQKAKEGTLEIPDDWREKIYTTEGMKKRVIFYNTSLAAMLAVEEEHSQTPGNEPGLKYLAKVQSVLEVFKQRDDVVLLWRPHPLMLSTMQTMRPHLLDRWIKIVSDFKKEGYGIYDESSDLHRAIAVSDAYYGDGSSVVPLFLAAGKGVFYSNFGGREGYLCNSDFFFMTMFAHQNALFSFILDKNLILKTDLEALNTQYFSSVPGKNPVGKKLYHHSVVMEDKVILVPYCNDDIAIYDFQHGKYEIYPLNLEQKYMLKGEGNFFNVCLYRNKLFLIPFAYRAVIAYDMETGETEHCLDLSEMFPVEEDNLMFHQYEYLDDSTILLPALRSNKLLEFNLETYQYKVHRIGQKGYRLNSIHRYNNTYWIVCLNQLKILRWEYESNRITEFDDFPESCTTRNSERAFFNVRGIFRYKNRLICIPAYCNMAVELNLDTGAIRKLEAFDKCFRLAPAYENVSWTDTGLQNGCLIYFLYGNRKIFCYDIESETISEICDVPPSLSPSDRKKVNDGYINAMVGGFLPTSVIDADAIKLSENAGKTIYNYTRNLILG